MKHPRDVHSEKFLRSHTLKKNTYHAISLYKKTELIGSFIFNVKQKSITSTYRFFPKKISIKLSASPSYIAESIFIKEALAKKVGTVWHGKDTNPYGINSAIGLAQYKLANGYTPVVSRHAEKFKKITTVKPKEDTLVLLGNKILEPITSAILYTNTPENYTDITKSKKISVTVKPYKKE